MAALIIGVIIAALMIGVIIAALMIGVSSGESDDWVLRLPV